MKNLLCLLALGCVTIGGCTTRTVSNTSRTAVEQLLLSTAVDRAMEEFYMPELAGQKAFVDFSRLDAVDDDYIQQAVRTAVAGQGGLLVPTEDEAELTVEVASGAMGTEYRTGLIGTPPIPIVIPGAGGAELPEVPFYKGIDQTGIAKLLIFVHRDGAHVAAAEYWARADRYQSQILWFRFFRRNDIREDLIEADAHLEERREQIAPPIPAAPETEPAAE